jgi:hypothetical protein
MSTLLVLGPMVAMMEDWELAFDRGLNRQAHLSHVLLLRSKVVETSSKLGVPSELGEGYSRLTKLLCHFVTVCGNLF